MGPWWFHLLPWVLLAAGAAGIPPHEDAARVARYVAHACDWGALATLSAREPLLGRPFANVFSLSDGPAGPRGSGVPYLYLTLLEVSVQDLQVNANASLTVSLAQTPYCKKKGYDPQNPLCAHIIFSGTVDKMKETEYPTRKLARLLYGFLRLFTHYYQVNGTEMDFAKLALFSRHPEMASWPRDHNWFFAKFNITNIWVLDYFGGLKTVTPEEYYSVTPEGKAALEEALRDSAAPVLSAGCKDVVFDVMAKHCKNIQVEEDLGCYQHTNFLAFPFAFCFKGKNLLIHS